MFRNLRAEMARHGLFNRDLVKTIEVKSEKTIDNKMNGRTEWTCGEMLAIRNTHFPNCTLDYLFGDQNPLAG